MNMEQGPNGRLLCSCKRYLNSFCNLKLTNIQERSHFLAGESNASYGLVDCSGNLQLPTACKVHVARNDGSDVHNLAGDICCAVHV